MSAVITPKRRFLSRRSLAAIAVAIVAAAGIASWRVFWVPQSAPVDSSRTFRDFSTILAEYQENGWECAMGPEGDGPYRSPVDGKCYSLIVGIQTHFKYRNELGEIDVTIPGFVDRAFAIAPLETTNGHLTYIVLEQQLPPDNEARQLAEKAFRDR